MKDTFHLDRFLANRWTAVIPLSAISSAALLHLGPARVLKRSRSLPVIRRFDLVQGESHTVNQCVGQVHFVWYRPIENFTRPKALFWMRGPG
jgi:hypothetical protein